MTEHHHIHHNHCPPYRTMPLSRSWDNGIQGDRDFLQPPSNKGTRTFQNRVPVEAQDWLHQSPDASSCRLGITPPTVSTMHSSPSPPRYMTYRNSLAGRVQTPYRSGNDTPSPQKPLDPVILSFDRKDEDSSSRSSSDDDNFSPKNLYASPLANLQERALQYSLEDEQPTEFRQGIKLTRTYSNAPPVDASEMDYSSITVPTSNKTRPVSRLAPPSDDEDSDEEARQGPGQFYLQVVKGNQVQAHAPTPPRRFDPGPRCPDRILECETNSEQSVALVDIDTPPDTESDQGSDLPPGHGRVRWKIPHEDEHSRMRRKFWGRLFICMALALFLILLLFVVLVDNKWTRRFTKKSESREPLLPLTIEPSKSPNHVSPTLSHTTNPSGPPAPAKVDEVLTLAPTILPSQIVVSVATPLPTWDAVRTQRLKEAVSLLSAWGRFELWEDRETTQAKAMHWWISNADWDSFPDHRKIQRYVLAVFYFAMDGEASWKNTTGWLSEEHECFWFTSSVSPICSKDSQALQILHLEQNELRGMLPAEIGLLSDLTEIRLVGNLILGGVPVEWQRLTRLRVVQLADNMLAGSGVLPHELASWSQLEVLDLSENRLGGSLPTFVAEFSALIYLMLGGNGFVGPLPPIWSKMNSLRVLSLERNHLTGGVPVSYAKGLVELRELRLAENAFDDFSPWSWEFRELQLLDMSGNQLNRTIPDLLYSIASLRTLNLSDNHITGQVSDLIVNLWQLEDLNLSQNRLIGELPEMLGGLSALKSLQLQDNDLSGDLPGSLRQLRSVEVLRIENNQFSRVDNICGSIDKDTLIEFYADCNSNEELKCTCCTHCCAEGGICSEVGVP